MKHYFLTAAVAASLIFQQDVKAQWTTSGTNIYNSNSGNVGIKTSNPNSPLEVAGKAATGFRMNGSSGDYEALAVYNTVATNQASGNGAVLQFYNNVNNYNTPIGASIKSVSSNNQYGWESDLYLRTVKNNSYSSQTVID